MASILVPAPTWLLTYAVEHGAKDLGSHNEAGGIRLDLDVARQQAHVLKDITKVTVLHEKIS